MLRSTDEAPERPRRIELDALLEELHDDGAVATETVVVGGGCAGLALGTALADRGRPVVVVEGRSRDRDGRTWCYWDTGEALLPEAVSRTWDRWEIRTVLGGTVAADRAHPYRMVRAHDYRVAARERIGRSARGRLVDGVHVATAASAVPGRPGVQVFDARGPLPAGPVPAGRVLLHQRFVGQWVRTARPVFEDGAVTLMDFPEIAPGEDVQFFYVLPVTPDLALVEVTVLSLAAHGAEPFRERIGAYLQRRWSLAAAEWAVEGEEAGSIPMTDARPATTGRSGTPIGLRAGIARPSTGYAFTRIQAAARRAAAVVDTAPPAVRDRLRIRVLDAIFLRFLRDQPHRAPAVFLRLFDRLPGPLTVRFLTERSSPIDELRLVLALPKAPFLRAAATTVVERVRARAR